MRKLHIRLAALTLVFSLLFAASLPAAAATQDSSLLFYEDAVQRLGSISLTDADALDLVYRSFKIAGAQSFAPQYKYLSEILLTLCGGGDIDYAGIEAKISMLQRNSAFIASYTGNGNLAYLSLDALQAYVQGRQAEAAGNAAQAYQSYIESQILDSLDRAMALDLQGANLPADNSPGVFEVGVLDISPGQDFGFMDVGTADTQVPQQEPIVFPNSSVRDVVKTAASVTGDSVYPADVASIDTLMLQLQSLSDISFLRYFTGLESLYLRNNSISDISVLGNLTKLNLLSLQDNQIEDISPLRSLPNLQVLYLDNNPVPDAQVAALKAARPALTVSYTPESAADLAAMAVTCSPDPVAIGDTVTLQSGIQNIGTADAGEFNIKWLVNGEEIAHSGHRAVAAGETVTDYNSTYTWVPQAAGSYTIGYQVDTELYVAESNEDNNLAQVVIEVSDQPALRFPSQSVEDAVRTSAGNPSGPLQPADVAKIKTLKLLHMSLSDISFLQYFTGLQRLYLTGNSISDVSPLKDLTKLTLLSLQQNQISDISPLQSLTQLQFLYLDGNPLSNAQVNELKAVLHVPLISYTPEPGPDLTATAITHTPSTVKAGDAVMLRSGVRNIGTENAGMFNVKWFINGAEAGYGGHEAVGAGQTVMSNNSQTTWTPQAAGTYTIEFKVDTSSLIEEIDEGNNTSEIVVTVLSQNAPTGSTQQTTTSADVPWPSYTLPTYSLNPILSADEGYRVQSRTGPSKNYTEAGAYKPYKMARTDGIVIEGSYVLVDMNYTTVGTRRVYLPCSAFSNSYNVPETTLEGFPAVTTKSVSARYGPGYQYDAFDNASVGANTPITVFFEESGYVFAEYEASFKLVRAWIDAGSVAPK